MPKKPVFILFYLCLFFLISCKKDKSIDQNPNVTAATGDLRDSIYELAQEVYLWNDALPSYDQFNPHRFTGSDIDPLSQELKAIMSYSPLNPVNNLNYDHFSFILKAKDYQDLKNNSSMGYGMELPLDPKDGNVRVAYVAQASPAYKQGVRRGWQLLSLNGIDARKPSKSTLTDLNKSIASSSVNFLFQNLAGQQVNVRLNQASISDDEVCADTVFVEGSKKIGYLVYNTFLTAPSSDAKNPIIHPGLDAAFSKFAGAGITDIIIDLRYNGGGYTDVSEQMANALIPAAFDNTLMYTDNYNDSLNNEYNQTKNEDIPHDRIINVNKNFSRNPSNLTVKNVVFIVSQNTASASELLINNLYPFFPNLKLVGLGLGKPAGADQRTAGKPFGFAEGFPLPEQNPIYFMSLINSEFKNSKNENNYVSGFTPDVQTYDGLMYNWGDPNEDGLKMALGYLVNGTFPPAPSEKSLAIEGRAAVSGLSNSPLGINLSQHRFMGSITRSFSNKKNSFPVLLKHTKKRRI